MPGLGPVLGFSLCLYFRHPSISDEKIAALVETTPDRAAAAVKSGSTVFSVKQQQRAVSAAEEFCVQISGGPLSALTCCVNVRFLSGDKKNIAVNLFSKLGWELGLYYASYDDFHPDILARMYT